MLYALEHIYGWEDVCLQHVLNAEPLDQLSNVKPIAKCLRSRNTVPYLSCEEQKITSLQ